MRLKRPWPGNLRKITPSYLAVIFAAFCLAVSASWTSLATRMDGEAYDWIFRSHPVPQVSAHSVVLAIDEPTLAAFGGMRNLRPILVRTLRALRPHRPAVVALDVTLADETDLTVDAALSEALAATANLVLPSNLGEDGSRWEEPLRMLRSHAVHIAHVHAAPDPVSRALPLEIRAAGKRRWALALEAAKLYLGEKMILETPSGLELGEVRIPATGPQRLMPIAYREGIPKISAVTLIRNQLPEKELKGRAIFIGVTPQSAARDRLMTPMNTMMSGVEIHAQAFETIVHRQFLTSISLVTTLGLCALYCVVAGAIFAFLSGWVSYAAAFVMVGSAHFGSYFAFEQGLIIPMLPLVLAAWFSAAFAAAWQSLVVRKQLAKSESDKVRYKEAIQFVTHEMRSPLTAIQGSSEIMGRYQLNEEKRQQIASMINSESKRLSRMIQTFLDIERLSDGQLDLRADVFPLDHLLPSCLERARPLADHKEIELLVDEPVSGASLLRGDRELMEYAVYNLLTNAIKYSGANTTVTVAARRDGRDVRLSITDQGIGMDEKELKNIFRKFYRTKKAEASGEAGTGIGLSLVDQIVSQHGGRVEVQSTPGKGSCFTLVLPVHAGAAALSR